MKPAMDGDRPRKKWNWRPDGEVNAKPKAKDFSLTIEDLRAAIWAEGEKAKKQNQEQA